jgi:hypothetical protein
MVRSDLKPFFDQVEEEILNKEKLIKEQQEIERLRKLYP